MQSTYNSDGTPVETKPQGYAFLSRTIISATGAGTYTVPAGVRAILVECIAGGGAGGSSASLAVSASAGGGGGGGAYSNKFITSLATSYSYSVGTGGTASAAGNNAGGNGNDTTFDTTTVVAKGGTGGNGGGAGTTTPLFVLGGLGGLASGGAGDVKLDGSPGETAYMPSGTVGCSGAGGNSFYGAGALARIAQAAGVTGNLFGGGGSGGLSLNGGAATQGGAGAAGFIIINEYG